MIIKAIAYAFHKDLADLGVETEDREIKFIFDSSTVEGIMESLEDDGEITTDKCMVFFKSGNTALVNFSYDELVEKIYGGE